MSGTSMTGSWEYLETRVEVGEPVEGFWCMYWVFRFEIITHKTVKTGRSSYGTIKDGKPVFLQLV